MTDAASSALDPRLRAWVAAELISAQQAEAIASWERGKGKIKGPSMAAEALAYVGGAVIVAAIAVIAIGLWDQMGLATQLAIPAVAAVLTLAAGAAVPRHWGDLGVRMRAALWLIAPVAVLVLMTVITERAEADYRLAMVVQAVPVFVVAAALWLAHRAAPQQLAAFTATTMVAVALLQWGGSGSWTGASFAAVALLWGIGTAAWLLPGMGRWAPPPGTWADPATMAERHRHWGWGLAAAGAVLGGIILGFGWDTVWAGIVPVAIVVATGVARSDLMVLIIGAVGTVIVLPAVTDHYLDSTVATAVVLLIVGAAMVGLSILVARRQAKRHHAAMPAAPGYSR